MGRSLGSRAVGVAGSLGELRPRVLAHIWGPPPVQFPGNRLAIPEESGGNGAGGVGVVCRHLGLSMRNEARAGSGVRGLTQPPGLYSDQVARWVEQGPRAQAASPSGSSTRSPRRFQHDTVSVAAVLRETSSSAQTLAAAPPSGLF